MHRPHCNVLQRPAARRSELKIHRRLVVAPLETRLLKKNRFLADFAAGIRRIQAKSGKQSRYCALRKRDQPARILRILGGAAGNSALRRFRCVEGVVVAGEILPRPPACQKDFFDKLKPRLHSQSGLIYAFIRPVRRPPRRAWAPREPRWRGAFPLSPRSRSDCRTRSCRRPWGSVPAPPAPSR